MPYAALSNFSGGLDGRKNHLTADAGTLLTLTNAHINRGGDIEKRKAFEIDATLPAGTFGVERTQVLGVVVFGSNVEPSMPTGVAYQRLQHPDNSGSGPDMDGVVFSTTYNGKPWVVASFNDGSTIGFYNGIAIADFTDGLVRAGHSLLSEVATELQAAIDAEADYSAGSDAEKISISGLAGIDFTATATATNTTGGTDDQTVSVATVQEPVPVITEVASVAKLQVTGAPGGTVDSVRVGATVIFDSVATGQTTDITIVTVGASLDNTWITLGDGAGTVAFWFDVDAAGGAPTSTGADRNLEVDILSSDTPTQVAAKLATAIQADSQFVTATSALGVVSFRNSETQNMIEPDLSNTESDWSFVVTNHGNVEWVASDANTAIILARAINQYGATAGGVSGVNVTSGGEFLLYKPTITFSAPDDPSGTQATGTVITSGRSRQGNKFTYAYNIGWWFFHRITGIVMTEVGSGYSTAPSITLNESSVYNYFQQVNPTHYYATKPPVLMPVVESSGEPVNYIATWAGDTVTLTAEAGLGVSPNGLTLNVRVEGGASNVGTYITVGYSQEPSDGIDAVAGVPKVVEVDLAGTLDVGDKYSIILTGPSLNEMKYGARRAAGINAKAAITFKTKLHFIADSEVYYSQSANSSEFDNDVLGSGLISIFEYSGGSEDLTAITTFQNNLAVFSRSKTQVWYVDPDDSLNQQLQVLDNVGALGPLCVVTHGDGDVFFVDDSGVRAMRPRDSSNSASIYDIGNPISALVLSDLATLTEAEKYAIPAILEPIDKRYWVSMNGKIYAYSRFPSSRISAWSKYTPEYSLASVMRPIDAIEKFVVNGNRLYFRGGVKQTESFTCVADVAGSLHQTYVLLYDTAGSVGFWFDVDAAGAAAPAGIAGLDRSEKINTIVTADDADTVATKVAAGITADSLGRFTATSSGAVVTVVNNTAKSCTGSGANGSQSPGFATYAVAQAGGEHIFNYGGTSNASYDLSPVVVEIPYLDFNKPAHDKEFTGLDFVVDGDWDVEVNTNPLSKEAWEKIGHISGSTFNRGGT